MTAQRPPEGPSREPRRTRRPRRSLHPAAILRAVARRSVRYARRLVRLSRRLARDAVLAALEPFRQRRLRASPAEEAALIASIRDGLPRARLTSGPLVSIVILNRNGRAHLDRCLRALAGTAYRDVEIIVVDNGSTDGSPELVEALALPFPVRVIRNAQNRSFSEANGQAVEVAKGEFICLLNNDVDPITDDWLGYLVETALDRGAAVVGARLIYPRHRGGRRAGLRHRDLSLQHGGVAFDRGDAIPRFHAIGAGGDANGAWAAEVADRPAVTAACVLVRRSSFEQVGGLSPEYDYGGEDIDLCLKLRAAGGRIAYDGRAAMWHHESATRAADRRRYLERVKRNRVTFVDAWGPRLFRDALLDALRGGDRFASEPFHVAIAAPRPGRGGTAPAAAPALRTGLESLGWRVSSLGRDGPGVARPHRSVEAVVVLGDDLDVRLLSRKTITIAWITGDPDAWLGRPWFDEFDVVFAPDERVAARVRDRSAKVAHVMADAGGSPAGGDPAGGDPAGGIRDALVAWASATRYGLRIGMPNWDAVDSWGDYHFARGLQRALERAGHPTRIHILPDWERPVAAREDVTVHLFGLKEAPTRRCQVNLLWHISHPDLASRELYERYDHVFVASDPFASRMAASVTVPVTPLHQATDPERYRPEPGGPHHQLLFVANSRKVHRRIIDDLAGTTLDLAIYGRHWTPNLVDRRFVKGEVVTGADIARYYSAADIVLNDHWDDMRDEGFISNRLYDALACGAFAVSDHVEGIEAEFDGAVPTYRARAELEPLLRRYLADPDERRRLAGRGRDIVLASHTFERRVHDLHAVAARVTARRPKGIDDSAPEEASEP